VRHARPDWLTHVWVGRSECGQSAPRREERASEIDLRAASLFHRYLLDYFPRSQRTSVFADVIFVTVFRLRHSIATAGGLERFEPRARIRCGCGCQPSVRN
jgi:hypothetical protein